MEISEVVMRQSIICSERPEWNFTGTGPKPEYGFFTEPEPNRNQNSLPKH